VSEGRFFLDIFSFPSEGVFFNPQLRLVPQTSPSLYHHPPTNHPFPFSTPPPPSLNLSISQLLFPLSLTPYPFPPPPSPLPSTIPHLDFPYFCNRLRVQDRLAILFFSSTRRPKSFPYSLTSLIHFRPKSMNKSPCRDCGLLFDSATTLLPRTGSRTFHE